MKSNITLALNSKSDQLTGTKGLEKGCFLVEKVYFSGT
jgi:hypothetical protein